MSVSRHPLPESEGEPRSSKWARRRDIPIAILAWTALVAVIIWGASHIVRTLLLLTIAALVAYAIAPGVKFLQRYMPKPLAILLMYLVVFSAIGALIYAVITSVVHQMVTLADFVRELLAHPEGGRIPGFQQTLLSLGLSSSQIAVARDQIVARLETLANSALPWLASVIDFLLDVVLVAVISIYFLVDGARTASWLRRNLPARARPDFLLDTLRRVVGGYIRGQFLLALLIGVLVGGGMFVFGVPYALLLGALAFVLEFIPILGTLLSGAICTLVALTRGWPIALGVLIYFIVVHILEGDIIGPRLVGKVVGLHPIVSIAALIAGAELFGIWGALLASPVAGVLQSVLIAFWIEWRETHPEQFPKYVEPKDAAPADRPGDVAGPDHS